MSAANLARRAMVLLAPLIVAVGMVGMVGCSSDEVRPDGASPTAPIDTTPVIVTDAPTTTQVPTADTPLVHQAVLDYWSAQRECQQRPSACRPSSFTADQGTLRSDITSAVSTLQTNSWHRGETDPNDGGYVAVVAITIAADATTATADECVYDPTPLLDRSDAVVTADAVPHRILHTLYLQGSTWKVGDEQVDPSTDCETTADSIPSDLTIPTT